MSFWLSHHRPDEYDRTVRLGGVHVCARCLGTYPTLLAALVAQFAVRAPLSWAWDGLWSIGLFLPAMVDWIVGRFRPSSGANSWRILTGVALGLALGRTLYIHFQRPLPVWLLAQLAIASLTALPVIVAAWLRRNPL